MKKLNLDKQRLIEEYLGNKKSTTQIAKKINCDRQTVWSYLKKYKIKRRTFGETNSIRLEEILTKEFLIKEYIEKKKSLYQIARETDSNIVSVWKYLKRFDIPLNIHKFDRILTKQFLIKEYIKNRKSINQIAKENNMFGKVIYKKLKKYKLKIRNKSEALKLRWKNDRDKIVRVLLEGLQIKPNKPEKVLSSLLNQILPKKYKYVGSGYTIIAGFCPDFIDFKNKLIIELFGDYWHNRKDAKARDKLRLKTYSKYGYQTLVIWQHELKNLLKIKSKIMDFNNK